MFSKYILLFKMTRPVNILIAIFTLLTGYCLIGYYPPILQLLIECISFSAAIAFGNIHNDVIDVKIDAVNQPDRALQSGLISLPIANSLAGICFGIPVILSIAPLNSTLHATFFALLLLILFAYNRWLKNALLLKNMTVAFLCTTPLILNILNNKEKAILIYPLILFAFFFMFSRELIKDIEDEPGDFKQGMSTFPILVGVRKASIFAILNLVFSLLTLILPVAAGIYNPLFLIFSGIPVTLLTIKAISKIKKKLFKSSQNFIKLAILAGIAGLILSQRVLVFY